MIKESILQEGMTIFTMYASNNRDQLYEVKAKNYKKK